MVKRFTLIMTVLAWITTIPSYSQSSADENAVKEVINKLFKGMELGDSAMVSSCLTNGTTMVSVFRDKNNNSVMHRDPNSAREWIKSIGTPHKDVYYEEFWNVKVQLDGDFAQAWCDYAFYVGNRFSHCGIDAFHMFKSKDGWKIFHLADTKRKSDCNIPQEIQNKHK